MHEAHKTETRDSCTVDQLRTPSARDPHNGNKTGYIIYNGCREGSLVAVALLGIPRRRKSIAQWWFPAHLKELAVRIVQHLSTTTKVLRRVFSLI